MAVAFAAGGEGAAKVCRVASQAGSLGRTFGSLLLSRRGFSSQSMARLIHRNTLRRSLARTGER